MYSGHFAELFSTNSAVWID